MRSYQQASVRAFAAAQGWTLVAEFSDVAYRQAHFHEVQELVECFFLIQDSHDAYHDGQAAGLPIGVLNAPEDLFDDEHLKAREFFVPVPLPTDERRTALFPGSPYRFDAFAAEPGRPPRLGEHTEPVRAELAARRAVQHA